MIEIYYEKLVDENAIEYLIPMMIIIKLSLETDKYLK
ncbi:MAG: hypothetical protein UZ09_BCD002001325 [Bacteroidetes bacterium OLB9]|nr:MAG: hypothetical protein UZ09_BCD002001325 [Bacteroidetes bacterium OLB9]